MLDEKTEYILIGVIVVTNWYGARGFAALQIETDEKGFREIEKNPRQDYLSYGVMSVDYVQFSVYRRRIIEFDDVKITVEEKSPFKTIEEGEFELTEDEEEALFISELIEIEY